MRLFVCVFACTSVQFLSSLSVCLWWFTSLQRCELFVFQVEVEEKSTTKNIQPFSLHGFSVVLDLPDFCVFLFVCLFVNLKSSYNTLITFAQLRRARSCSESWERRCPRRCACCLLFLLVNPCCCCCWWFGMNSSSYSLRSELTSSYW